MNLKTKKQGRKGLKFLAQTFVFSIIIMGIVCFNEPVEASPKRETCLVIPPDTIPETEASEYRLEAVISPTKMNVFYLGAYNPVSIAVSGTQSDKIKVSIDNGSIRRANRRYIVRAKKIGIASITVKVDDKIVSIQKFRVKMIPDPVPAIPGMLKGTTNISRSRLIAIRRIEAKLHNFDYDVRFKVISFTISTNIEGVMHEAKQNDGYSFTQEQMNLIRKIPRGKKIYIEDIKAMGPGGIVRELGALVLKIM